MVFGIFETIKHLVVGITEKTAAYVSTAREVSQ